MGTARINGKRLRWVKYLGCSGSGFTLTEAKKDAMQRIQAAFEGYTSPSILQWRGVTAVLYWGLSSWEYAIVHPDSPVDVCGHVQHGANIESADRLAALERVKWHLAQIAWKLEDGKGVPLIMRGCSDHYQNEHVCWARWQLAAHHARHVLGITDSNAVHSWACQHEGEF